MSAPDPAALGVHVSVDERGLARIGLDDGRAVNVLSRRRMAALTHVLVALAGASRPRAVLLVGNPRGSFAAGADLREISELDAAAALSLSIEGARVMQLLSEGPWPTGAFVDGHALGGGCDLALSCDAIGSTPRSVSRRDRSASPITPPRGPGSAWPESPSCR